MGCAVLLFASVLVTDKHLATVNIFVSTHGAIVEGSDHITNVAVFRKDGSTRLTSVVSTAFSILLSVCSAATTRFVGNTIRTTPTVAVQTLKVFSVLVEHQVMSFAYLSLVLGLTYSRLTVHATQVTQGVVTAVSRASIADFSTVDRIEKGYFAVIATVNASHFVTRVD